MLLRAVLALMIAFTGPMAVASPMHFAAKVEPKKDKPACKELPPMAKPAPCPEIPAMAMGMHHMPMPEQGRHHDENSGAQCVGCIAPATVKLPNVQDLIESASLPPSAEAADGLRLAALTPASPPPRRG